MQRLNRKWNLEIKIFLQLNHSSVILSCRRNMTQSLLGQSSHISLQTSAVASSSSKISYTVANAEYWMSWSGRRQRWSKRQTDRMSWLLVKNRTQARWSRQNRFKCLTLEMCNAYKRCFTLWLSAMRTVCRYTRCKMLWYSIWQDCLQTRMWKSSAMKKSQ
jgi:hypothetical protein